MGYLILKNFIEVKVTPYGVRMKQLESAEDVVKHILQNEDSHNERADLDLTQILFDEEVVRKWSNSLCILIYWSKENTLFLTRHIHLNLNII